jgi:ABC-type Mn2+/Zn2+ transport system permease subunit
VSGLDLALTLGESSEHVATFLNVRQAYLATLLIALVCGYLGLFTLLRRIVFTGVALAQLAAAGVAAALFAEQFAPLARFAKAYGATSGSLAASLSGALALELRRDQRRIPQGALVGGLYVVASALAILFVWRSPHGLAELRNLVAGEVLLSRQQDLLSLWIGLPLIAALHLRLRQPFLLVSCDPIFARSLGLPERRYQLLFVTSLAAAIALALKAGGLLLVFAFLVLPGLAALRLGSDLDEASWLAPCLGLGGAGLGFGLAVVADLPVAPSVSLALIALWGGAWLLSLRPGLARAGRASVGALALAACLLSGWSFLAAPPEPHAPAPPPAGDVHGHEHDHEHGVLAEVAASPNEVDLGRWLQLLEEGESATLRREAAHHLEDLGHAGALDGLLVALNDDAPEVREAAGKAVACLAAERQTRERLASLAQGEDPELRILAALGQISSGEREGIGTLVASLHDEEAPLYLRQRGLDALRSINRGRALGLDLDEEELTPGLNAWRAWWIRSRAQIHWDPRTGRFLAPR